MIRMYTNAHLVRDSLAPPTEIQHYDAAIVAACLVLDTACRCNSMVVMVVVVVVFLMITMFSFQHNWSIRDLSSNCFPSEGTEDSTIGS
jgi:hypothetical protein